MTSLIGIYSRGFLTHALRLPKVKLWKVNVFVTNKGVNFGSSLSEVEQKSPKDFLEENGKLDE